MAQTAAALAASSLGAATVGAGCAPSAACIAAVRDLMGKKLESFISFGSDIFGDPTMMTLNFDAGSFQVALGDLLKKFGAHDVMAVMETAHFSVPPADVLVEIHEKHPPGRFAYLTDGD